MLIDHFVLVVWDWTKYGRFDDVQLDGLSQNEAVFYLFFRRK